MGRLPSPAIHRVPDRVNRSLSFVSPFSWTRPGNEPTVPVHRPPLDASRVRSIRGSVSDLPVCILPCAGTRLQSLLLQSQHQSQAPSAKTFSLRHEVARRSFLTSRRRSPSAPGRGPAGAPDRGKAGVPGGSTPGPVRSVRLLQRSTSRPSGENVEIYDHTIISRRLNPFRRSSLAGLKGINRHAVHIAAHEGANLSCPAEDRIERVDIQPGPFLPEHLLDPWLVIWTGRSGPACCRIAPAPRLNRDARLPSRRGPNRQAGRHEHKHPGHKDDHQRLDAALIPRLAPLAWLLLLWRCRRSDRRLANRLGALMVRKEQSRSKCRRVGDSKPFGVGL